MMYDAMSLMHFINYSDFDVISELTPYIAGSEFSEQ